ncbi:MAG: glutamine synthetase family protein [Promethearchaeota archaeon]
MSYKTSNHGNIRDINLQFKKARSNPDTSKVAEERVRAILNKGMYKAVTVCFSDIEGRLHMLDYDKDFLLASADNLTFDGSSIRGFTAQHESDLKIHLDWGATYLLPGDYFGFGKLFMFGEIRDKDDSDYSADIRSVLRRYLKELKYRVNVSAEIEGFLFKGKDQEKTYHQHRKFECLTTGGYFNTLPGDPLRSFIDQVAEVQRDVGFENEKDHPEVAPSQFEINWSYTDALIAADQIQLYKMICRQLAAHRNLTACFLPKPVVGVNGSGMHLNLSLENVTGKNVFYDDTDPRHLKYLSAEAWTFLYSVLHHAEQICLALNPSVNAYRRLDPAYEAPNEIKASVGDRSSMIRIPIGNEKSARLEIRTVAPDANPYLAILAILKAGFTGNTGNLNLNAEPSILPADIYTAINYFADSDLMLDALGREAHAKYIIWKEAAADRCPKRLGTAIKAGEVMFHHEVTNQQLWGQF